MWHMLTFSSTYVNYGTGASRSTQNIASSTWVIFSPTNKLVSSGNILLCTTTNNIVKYNVVVKLMLEASILNIHRLIVWLDSKLMVLHLYSVYSIHSPILFCKYFRVHLLERTFEFISDEHILREFYTLVDSLAYYVLDCYLSH